ncbi:hypothetical protein CANARDRAFT_181421, partial [[Candida] arabinofermentans NRRL YB-2248]
QQLKKLVQNVQFYWFLSHVFGICFMILSTISSMFRGQSSPSAIRYYNYSINSTIITYLIVIRQTYKTKPISFMFSQAVSLLRDDNVQYLLLAVLFRMLSAGGMSSATLYPFAIIASFHTIVYFNNNILNHLPYLSKTKKNQISKLIVDFNKDYNERGLYIAANLQIMLITTYILPLVKMIVFFQLLRARYFFSNLKTIILFTAVIVFNKLRFDQNKYTKSLVEAYDARVNQFLHASPMIPQNVKTLATEFRSSALHYLKM